MAMTAVRAVAVGGPASLSRFRGALVAAVVGDCVGGEFEGAEEVPMENVLQHLNSLDDETKGNSILDYSDDTAMARCVVQSLLTRTGFDEQDMARRFAKEYSASPGRGYGSGVIQVLKKLSSPQLSDVYQPARDQFNGRGSFGNGGAMRVAPFALAFPDIANVKRFARLGAMLTHSCSLGYNGAVLQALAVHLSLQGALDLPQEFISKLINEMEEVEGDKAALNDARILKEAEKPFCERLRKVRYLMNQSKVSIEEVISELGNGIAALHSVPTAIFCVLHCLQPREYLPESYGGLERTIAYSLALGGDTDTIACMAGAIAGAHYGIEAIPQSWIKCCEGAQDADMTAERLYMLYHQSSKGGRGETGEQSCKDKSEEASKASNCTEKKNGAE
ncbi:ADP-ribosylhydrolase ARH3 [Parambassis ranga]|uniref:ADP-ribosylhydrolase ARH3 n=1 Tax=Parambassis ranga TaxID=210632 RepID=A0A6P7H7R9_9TELE|nr:ADP-ribose glycohydrolase ARH3 [Parambassis ranga]XP_028251245.1 ADP-ribose glycohydrolase ARH3 [Parambassis ranga]